MKATRPGRLVLDLGLDPVVPPKSNRLEPWEYDRERYRKRNEVERLFWKAERFQKHIFSILKSWTSCTVPLSILHYH